MGFPGYGYAQPVESEIDPSAVIVGRRVSSRYAARSILNTNIVKQKQRLRRVIVCQFWP